VHFPHFKHVLSDGLILIRLTFAGTFITSDTGQAILQNALLSLNIKAIEMANE